MIPISPNQNAAMVHHELRIVLSCIQGFLARKARTHEGGMSTCLEFMAYWSGKTSRNWYKLHRIFEMWTQ